MDMATYLLPLPDPQEREPCALGTTFFHDKKQAFIIAAMVLPFPYNHMAFNLRIPD